MPETSQFRLLLEGRFAPFFGVQFLGALNDNIFKQALVILLAYQSASFTALPTDMLQNLAQALFVLPFFLSSALLERAYDKSHAPWMPATWWESFEVTRPLSCSNMPRNMRIPIAARLAGFALSLLLVPDVTDKALPAIFRLRELIARFVRRLVAQVTQLHLLMQFAHGKAAGACPELRRRAFRFIGVGLVGHGLAGIQ
jgi:hypothetical protein